MNGLCSFFSNFISDKNYIQNIYAIKIVKILRLVLRAKEEKEQNIWWSRLQEKCVLNEPTRLERQRDADKVAFSSECSTNRCFVQFFLHKYFKQANLKNYTSSSCRVLDDRRAWPMKIAESRNQKFSLHLEADFSNFITRCFSFFHFFF